MSSVALDSLRIQPHKKELLKYNIRRRSWERWYCYTDWAEYPGAKQKRGILSHAIRLPVKAFWGLSDYGLSTGRVLAAFLGFAFIFACIYYGSALIQPPGIVSNLFVASSGEAVQSWLVPLRSLYFSIVTMTTLGFGDMYAHPQSLAGHLLLILQVLLGYILLGALVTRFAVIFTSGGPSGGFKK